MGDININQAIGAIWDKKSTAARNATTRSGNWWACPRVYAHIGKKIGGSFAEFIHAETGGRKFKRAISVGCGAGTKELQLVKAGIVERFDLYELSKERVEMGRAKARTLGLSDAMNFHVGDAFEACKDAGVYDCVHWNNSLHHMLDTAAAIEWSHHVLADDGAFVMDDFVGPSRFQWSEFNLRVASEVRAALPNRLLQRGADLTPLHKTVFRKTIKQMLAMDPSEAADSSNILPSLRRVFPLARIVLTGGAIYHLALAGVYAQLNTDNEDDRAILDIALQMDDLMSNLGETHYAVAVAFKNTVQ
jgi:SAM-dependent methyltransferase